MSEVADATNEMNLTASFLLSEARESLGLSQEEVAQELFLIPNYIRLIDSDQIDKIDKQAFVRGYLRSYAKLVNLDGDDMVARFEKTQGAQPQRIEIRGVTQEPVGSTNFTGPVIQTGVFGLICLVVVVSLVWFLVSTGDEEPAAVGARSSQAEVVDESPALPESLEQVGRGLSSAGAIETSTIAETGSQDASAALGSADASGGVDQVEPEGEASQPVDAILAATDLTATQQSQTEVLAEAEVIEAAAQATSDAPISREQAPTVQTASANGVISIERVEDVIQVNAGGPDELRFSFSAECWVEIEDANGKSIYGDLNRDGDELVVSGAAPFEVLFGKAPAVTMVFNGEPFDLNPHTTAVDTAKVKVGN